MFGVLTVLEGNAKPHDARYRGLRQVHYCHKCDDVY